MTEHGRKEHQGIIIDHIHPLKERIIGMEKTVEYHERELSKVTSMLENLTASVSENTDLVKKIWYLMIGGGSVVIGGWAIIKFVLPLIGVPVE